MFSHSCISLEKWREALDRQPVNKLSTTFLLIVLSVSWLSLIMIFLARDIKYAKSSGKLRELIGKIEYLETLQIFLYDDQLLKHVPQNLRQFIKTRRNTCESFVMSKKKIAKYKI